VLMASPGPPLIRNLWRAGTLADRAITTRDLKVQPLISFSGDAEPDRENAPTAICGPPWRHNSKPGRRALLRGGHCWRTGMVVANNVRVD